MISIDVRSDEVLGFMDRFSAQAPFAISLGVNRLTELAMASASKGIKARMIVRVPTFTLPPTQIPSSYRATKARLYATADIAYGTNTTSRTGEGMGARRRAILAKFEDGGVKRAVDPNLPIAIPTKALRPTPTGLIDRKLYPRNLVGGFTNLGTFVGLGRKARLKGKRQKQVGRYFVLGQSGDRGYGIYERLGTNSIRMLWAFRSQIPIPPLLHYMQDISDSVQANYANELSSAMDYAIATAK